ncbi:MAG: redoxin domain-containing protein [Rhizobacter sp.]|nr:redoxin domain-containing protein [Bacteriovorax sp.]
MKFLILFFLMAFSLNAAEVTNFNAATSNGLTYELFSHSKAKAIVVIAHSTSCPIVRQTSPRLEEIIKQYKKKNVEFIYLNSNLQDDLKSINKEVKEYNISIPVIMDKDQKIIKNFGLKVTAETIIINPATWSIVYKGAIDDQINYASKKSKAIKNYLADALDDVLAGKEIRVKSSRPFGCSISIN